MEHSAKKTQFKSHLQIAEEKRQQSGELSDYVFGKVQPQAIPLEEAVLGAMMLDKEALGIVIDILKPATFYVTAHGTIFEAILRLYARTQPVDLLTVTMELKLMNKLDEIGGGYYLTEMTNRVGSSANIEYHARILVQMHILRELIAICSTTIKKCYNGSFDPFELCDELSKKVAEMLNFSGEARGMGELVGMSIKQFEAWTKAPSGLVGVTSGLKKVDRLTHGWQKGDLICLAARPGMGKTAFIISCALNAAQNDDPVAVFSLEMKDVSLSNRIIAQESGVSTADIKAKRVTESDWQQIHVACERVSELPIYIDETPAIGLMELRAKARRLKQKYGLSLIIIDYMQLMSGDETNGKKNGNREQDISSISRGLKALAKELDVPVIALSQLSRAVETRGGTKRPMLSDLRESGAIEQDSDIVVFIYRPEYYQILEDEFGGSLKGIAEIIIAKHRDGALDTAKVRFNDRLAKFSDLEENDFEIAIESVSDPFSAPFTPQKVMTRPSGNNSDEDIPF